VKPRTMFLDGSTRSTRASTRRSPTWRSRAAEASAVSSEAATRSRSAGSGPRGATKGGVTGDCGPSTSRTLAL
jgi:hypothetical protein